MENTHIDNAEYRHRMVDNRLKWLEERYSTFNEEFGSVKADVKWLVKFFWIVATSSIGAFLMALFNLVVDATTK